MSSSFLFLTRLPLYLGALLACGRDFPSLSSRSCLVGLFSSFVLPLAILFFQPGNVVMGVIALALCLLKCYILKEYWLWFERLGIIFFP